MGRRCHELRILDAKSNWRVIYRIDADAMVILEVFPQKTSVTPKGVIDTCRPRPKRMTMRARKNSKLNSNGWKVGTAKDFPGLSDEEEAYIDLRLRLAEGLKARRRARGVTQVEMAKSIKSSQSRVAKMEAGHPTVSLDLLLRSLLALGATNRELAAIISRRQ